MRKCFVSSGVGSGRLPASDGLDTVRWTLSYEVHLAEASFHYKIVTRKRRAEALFVTLFTDADAEETGGGGGSRD